MYKEYENLLKKICHQFKYSGIEFDDLFSIANETYTSALKEFEESRKIKFSTMLYTYTKNAIINEIRHNKRRKNEIKVENLTHFSNSDNPEKKIIFINNLKHLSKEAHEVVQFILSSPSEILKIAGINTPKKMRGFIYKKLKKQKWPERKIFQTFAEIKEALK